MELQAKSAWKEFTGVFSTAYLLVFAHPLLLLFSCL